MNIWPHNFGKLRGLIQRSYSYIFLWSCHPHIFRVAFVLCVNLYYLCFQSCSLKLKIQLKVMVKKSSDFKCPGRRGESLRPVYSNNWKQIMLFLSPQGLNFSYYFQYLISSCYVISQDYLQNTGLTMAHGSRSCLFLMDLQNNIR